MSEPSNGNHPGWTQLYEAALLELDRTKLPGRIDAAQRAIEVRIALLRSQSGSSEMRSLEDAMRNLRSLLRQSY